MSVEQRLGKALTHAAEGIDVGDARIEAVIRRAERRSSRNRTAASVAGLVVLAAAVLGVSQLAGITTPDLDILGAPDGARPVAVFLCDDRECPEISGETRDRLRADLEGEPEVLHVTFESKQDAYHRFREEFADQPDLIGSVSPDAFPPSFRLLLSANADADAFAARYRSREGVEEVVITTESERVFDGSQTPGVDGSAR